MFVQHWAIVCQVHLSLVIPVTVVGPDQHYQVIVIPQKIIQLVVNIVISTVVMEIMPILLVGLEKIVGKKLLIHIKRHIHHQIQLP